MAETFTLESRIITGTTLDPHIIELLHFQTLHLNETFVWYDCQGDGFVEKVEYPRASVGSTVHSYCWCDLPLITGVNCKYCYKKTMETRHLLEPMYAKCSFKLVVVENREYPVGKQIEGFDASQMVIPIPNTNDHIDLLSLLQMEKKYEKETLVWTQIHWNDQIERWIYIQRHLPRGFRGEESKPIYCWCNIPLPDSFECNKCRSEINTLDSAKGFLNYFHFLFKVKIVSVPKLRSSLPM